MRDKQHILDEIRRTAAANDGKPLGSARFQAETGITQTDWYGRFWRSWSEALKEAGAEECPVQQAQVVDRIPQPEWTKRSLFF